MRSALARYAFAIAATLAAGALRWALDPVLGDRAPLILFIAPVLITSLLAGLGPAMLAVFLSAIGGLYLFISPRYEFSGADRLALANELVFVAIAALVGVLGAAFRRRTVRLEQQTARLKESDQRFRIMADGMPLIVWVHGPNGEQEFVNKTFCEFFGVTREEMKGSRWQALMHPDDAEAYSNEFIRCVREREPFHAEVRVKRADGQWRWIESWAQPRHGAAGDFLGYVGTSADITERRQVEKQRDAVQDLLSKVVETSPALIVVTDAQGRIEMFNKACEEVTGYSREDVMGKNLAEMFLPAEWKPIVAQRFSDIDSPSLREPHANPWLTKNGEARIIEWRCVPLKHNGDPLRVMGAGIDISNRVKQEEQQAQHRREIEAALAQRTAELTLRNEQLRRTETLASLGALSRGLAHDLGNLILPIETRLQILLGQELPESVRDHIQALNESSKYMRALTARLRDYMHFAQNPKLAATLQPEKIRLDRWCGEIVSFLHTVIPPSVRLVCAVPSGLPSIVANKAVLTQAIFNLVQNASQIIQEHGVGNQIELRAEADNGTVRISVEDNGPGMEDHVRERCLEPFFTTGPRGAGGGSGIGLALVRSFVESVKGAIMIESPPAGKPSGTAFILSVPAMPEVFVLAEADAQVLTRDDSR